VKIIDFGSTKIAGIEEIATPLDQQNILGTRNYSAPEYLQGYSGNNVSDIYSLGVITYEMLTGHLPYGDNEMTPRRLRSVRYIPARLHSPDVPLWIDRTLEKAVSLACNLRYGVLSEFVHDLTNPNPAFLGAENEALLERNPLLVWKGASLLLLLVNLYLFYLLVH